jgi:membrane-associated protease RseP (regulator of RpoE activity)
MSTISVYIAPLLVFGLVVFVHELGHFMAAKMTGVYAPVFSLGWGRRLFGWRRGETDYRVSLIPLGGYVRMASRDDDALAGIEGAGADRGSLDSAPAQPTQEAGALWDDQAMAPFGPKPVPADRWVESKSTSARVFILSAGVLMNILLTYVVATGLSYKAGNAYVPAVIDSVVAGAPAAAAGRSCPAPARAHKETAPSAENAVVAASGATAAAGPGATAAASDLPSAARLMIGVASALIVVYSKRTRFKRFGAALHRLGLHCYAMRRLRPVLLI